MVNEKIGFPDVKKSDLVLETKSLDNQTVAASSTISGTLSVAKTGYKPIALAGFRISNASTNGTSSSRCFFYQAYLSGNNFAYAIRNTLTSSDAIIRIYAYVLYVKE